MGMFEILSLLFSIVGAGMGMYSQQETNQQNVQNANSMLATQQGYAEHNAEVANQKTQELYNQIYSPAAKMRQLKEAGLSPGLYYSGGAAGTVGTTAVAASTPAQQVPTINPVIQQGLVQSIIEATKSAAETKKTEGETKKVDVEIKEVEKNIQKIEADIQNTKVSTLNTELQNKLLDNEVKISNATITEQIELVKANLDLINNNADKALEEARGLKIKNEKQKELVQAELDLMVAEKEKYVKEKLLIIKQTVTEEAKAALINEQKNLTEQQKKEIQAKMEDVEKWGWMVVNSGGWQDRLVTAFLSMCEGLARALHLKKDK